jgi:hypothetical protein
MNAQLAIVAAVLVVCLVQLSGAQVRTLKPARLSQEQANKESFADAVTDTAGAAAAVATAVAAGTSTGNQDHLKSAGPIQYSRGSAPPLLQQHQQAQPNSDSRDDQWLVQDMQFGGSDEYDEYDFDGM